MYNFIPQTRENIENSKHGDGENEAALPTEVGCRPHDVDR
jgi:hypothetical protein